MNRIAIRNNLNNVINDLLNDINFEVIGSKDENNLVKSSEYELRLINNIDDFITKIKKSIIISGGAITSLFLNEEVNDYDIYFTDSEIIDYIREFFLTRFNTINKTDYKWSKEFNCLYKYKFNNVRFLQKYELLNEFEKYVDIQKFISGKNSDKFTFVPICFTSNAISLVGKNYKIQLITRFTGTAEEIISNFDFIHTNNYYNFFENKIYTNQKSLESILCKELIYNGSKFPICSLIRSKKFIKRGWNISPGEYLKIVFQINKLNLNNINILEEQLTGVDSAYFIKFLDKLKGFEKIEDEDILKILNEICEEITEDD
jgi:hypothetical protein